MHNLRHPSMCEVWLLHSITSKYSRDKGLRACEISPSTLETKINEAISQHKKFISVKELEEVIIKNKFKNKYVCITLDDGYRNNLTAALPIFERYRIPFCVFVCPGFVIGDYNPSQENKKEMLSVDELRELAQNSLCTIGAHTMSHIHLENAIDDIQHKEILESKLVLEHWIEKEVVYFAYPYGGINSASYSVLQKNGFRMGFGAWGGAITKDNLNKWWIPRVIISEIEI